MKTIKQYECEISGRKFDKKTDAIKYEKMMLDIQNTFSFYKKIKDDNLSFANGKYAIQRDEDFYNKLLDGLIKMIKKYEKSLWVKCKDWGGLTRDNVKGHSSLGRWLGDSDSPLYHWWGIQGNICPKCYREYGQMYYALNCKHTKKV